MMKRIYLDHAATTPTDPDVVKAMLPYFTEVFGNPSTIYSFGQEAKSAVDQARSRIAKLIGAHEEEIVFTSGGTEADNFAIIGTINANKKRGNHIITTTIEHHAILETCKFLEKNGCSVTYVPVDRYGVVDPGEIRKAITDKTVLISVMHANNEVGTIEPISEISRIAREAGIPFHTDAVQTVGHIPVNVDKLRVDLLALSAHKFYGPKGVGVLYIRKGTRMVSFLHGGEQERRRRAGTENIPGIVGLGAAAEIAGNDLMGEAERLTTLRERLIQRLFAQIPNARLNGHPANRLPGNANISVDFVEGESMCLNLDLQGICVSTGSACSSASLEPSHVLLALGNSPEMAHGSLRFTMGRRTTEEEIERVISILPPIVNKLRAMSPLWKSNKVG